MLRKRHIGGVLLLGSLILGPFWVPYYYEYLEPPHNDDWVEYATTVAPFIFLMAFGCIMAFVGATMAFKGNSWRRTMFVAFFSVFTIGPFFLGTFLGALAIIYLANARQEFDEDPSQYGPDILRTHTTR